MSSRTVAGGDTVKRDRRPTVRTRTAVRAMYAGLATTIIATIVPYIDRATSDALSSHIRAGYPDYSHARIQTAATIYLVYLTVVGVLGAAGWLWIVHALRAGKRWARAGATAMFALGASVALTDLLIRDRSGATALPPLLAWLGVVPSLIGLVAVIAVWRAP